MVRGGKVNSKCYFRKRAWSKGGGSDDSDEDYVVSDEDICVSDCPDDYCSSLDECASEESFDGLVEDEEEEARPTRRLNRSRAKSGVCGWQKNASKAPQKRRRITHAIKEQEPELEGDADEDEDKDFEYDDADDDEFTPEEEDYFDEEEEIRERKKKKNNGVKVAKKVLNRRASVTSTRCRKRRSPRASKKPLRKRRRNGGLKRNVRRSNVDDFIDNVPFIRTKRRKKQVRKKKALDLGDSNSEYCVSSGSSDYEFTISEEEREQVREARELCQRLRRNLRSAMTNEDAGIRENLFQHQKSPGQKGKEKIEEPQGRKGKEKVADLKIEVGKQVCGICLSEENKRRVRGVLNCCTHYFCFSCIMEWGKVESRCPLCKQRFKTISKPARSTTGVDSKEVVVQVPERDQVYQPSEEELRSYIDPYESVFCSECNQGGDDGLMLLCDICDSPAHTYCVGLGREVPEGNWYCNGCRPVALGSSGSQVQEHVDDPHSTTQSIPSPANVREIIDLNLVSSPRASLSQGFGHISSYRFSGRGGVEASSPISGGGAPTLSGRRWLHRQIHQLRSIDRMASTTGITNGISAASSPRNLNSSQINQSGETNAAQHTRIQDVGTSYHPFHEERLCNNNSSLMQNGVPSSMRTSNAIRPVNGVLWPGLLGTPLVSNYEPVHQSSSRSNIGTDGSLSPAIKEESNFKTVKEQLQLMVKNHLTSLSRDLGYSTFKEVARSSTHTILAACGLEHKKSEVCNVLQPSVCPHIELKAGGQTSLIKSCCSSCFDSYVKDVVERILNSKTSPQWLRLGL